jgi:hypothetical protein
MSASDTIALGAMVAAVSAVAPEKAAVWVALTGLVIGWVGVHTGQGQDQKARLTHYDKVYAPAVNWLLPFLTDAYRRFSNNPEVTKNTLLAAEDLTAFCIKLYAPGFLKPDEDERLHSVRVDIQGTYREWSDELGRIVGRRPFRRWLASFQGNHVAVFRLWAHLEVGLATARRLEPVDFGPFRRLARHWSVSLPV